MLRVVLCVFFCFCMCWISPMGRIKSKRFLQPAISTLTRRPRAHTRTRPVCSSVRSGLFPVLCQRGNDLYPSVDQRSTEPYNICPFWQPDLIRGLFSTKPLCDGCQEEIIYSWWIIEPWLHFCFTDKVVICVLLLSGTAAYVRLPGRSVQYENSN